MKNATKVFFFGLFLFLATALAGKPLLVEVTEKGDVLLISAVFDTKGKTYQVEGWSDLEKVYGLLERGKARQGKFETTLEDWGSRIWGPIEPFVEACSEIRIVIPERLVKIPFDLLYLSEEPLFLWKPVLYSFKKCDTSDWGFSGGLSALLISDKTADPDRGVLSVKKMLPAAEYFDIGQVSLRGLARVKPKDLLLISAHGEISFGNDDYIQIDEKGDEMIKPSHLSSFAPRLVYLDSCQLGASLSFIRAFQAAGTIWYVAPITSNEAGNSSTKTIKFFFQGLQEGLSPPVALFKARQKLYEIFEETDSLKSLLERAFPFRMYQLN